MRRARLLLLCPMLHDRTHKLEDMKFDVETEARALAFALEILRAAGCIMIGRTAMQLITEKLQAAHGKTVTVLQKPDRRPKLTERQRELLDMVVEYASAHGYPPTLRDIGQHIGIRSTNGVSDHLKALEKKGYIVREELKSRSIRVINWPTQGAERMAANGFDFHETEGQDDRPRGVWRGDILVYRGAPAADETVVNELASSVGRPPLDVLAEIVAMVVP